MQGSKKSRLKLYYRRAAHKQPVFGRASTSWLRILTFGKVGYLVVSINVKSTCLYKDCYFCLKRREIELTEVAHTSKRVPNKDANLNLNP